MNKQLLEAELAALPLLQYAFAKTEELTFSENIRHICRTECPMYGRTWACPPAVGEVEVCRRRCMEFDELLIISTAAEVQDISDIDETLATRAPHEELTRAVRDIVDKYVSRTMVLSTEACCVCPRCAYLDGQPCRYPEKMFPCVESHGIIVTDIAEKYGMEFFLGGNVVTWFSLIFYK